MGQHRPAAVPVRLGLPNKTDMAQTALILLSAAVTSLHLGKRVGDILGREKRPTRSLDKMIAEISAKTGPYNVQRN
jgi:hypothetical protein